MSIKIGDLVFSNEEHFEECYRKTMEDIFEEIKKELVNYCMLDDRDIPTMEIIAANIQHYVRILDKAVMLHRRIQKRNK